MAPTKTISDVVHPEERDYQLKVREQLIYERTYEKILDHWVKYPDAFFALNRAITVALSMNRRIAIYPYGMNGKLCEKILRDKYGVMDYLIVDNMAEKTGRNILKAYQLAELQEEIFVIETCVNPTVHQEVLDVVKEYVDSKYVYSAFVPNSKKDSGNHQPESAVKSS